MIRWRDAQRQDVPAIVALLADDDIGATRESDDLSVYHAAFDAMSYEYGNTLIVGETDGRVVATYQLTFITGLSRQAGRRAQLEAVRVARKLRSEGVGRALIRDAEMRAVDAGCSLIQLTSDKSRTEAGFEPSHIGFKKNLS